jgi:hypothetical protein
MKWAKRQNRVVNKLEIEMVAKLTENKKEFY